MTAPYIVPYGQGDHTLSVVPLDDALSPVIVSSASYKIEDLREYTTSSKRVVSSGTVVQESSSTTLTGNAGPTQADPFVVPVASTTGFATREHLLLTAASGYKEEVVVDALSVDSVRSRHPLRREFVTGDTIRQVELRCTFPSSVANDENRLLDGGGPFRVQWVYEVGGRDYVLHQLVWLKRSDRPVVATPTDVLEAWPEAAFWTHNELSVEKALVSAHKAYYAALAAAGVDPSRWFVEDVARQAVVNLALYYLHLWRSKNEVSEVADRFREEWKSLVSAIVQGVPGADTAAPSEKDVADEGPSTEYVNRFILT